MFLKSLRKDKIMVSGCLCGIRCRYDAKSNKNPEIADLLQKGMCIPVCPEQLGGLATPRHPCSISRGDGFDVLAGRAEVITDQGIDVTENFIRGAREVLRIALTAGIEEVIFKEKSPSCGVKKIYHGDTLVEGCGVTTALLLKHGIRVNSDLA